MSCLHYFEKYLNINSVIHRINPAVKITIVILYILLVVITPSEKIVDILFCAIPVLIFILLSKVPLLYIFSRSLVIIPFTLFLSISMPFHYMDGYHVLMQFNIVHFDVRITEEGMRELAGVLLKSYFSVLSMIVLTSTTSFPALMRGFRILYIPKTLIVIIGFMYRYITVIAEEALIMLRARDCRYFGGFSLRQIKITGNMVAILFIRTLERSEKIYSSMLSRGYDGEIRTINRDVFTWYDIVFAVLSVILILTVKVANNQWKIMQ
ncbi:MAG: cobalt ECF transporter T component CbiQ [Candidatus Eremiobacterota bacterium]